MNVHKRIQAGSGSFAKKSDKPSFEIVAELGIGRNQLYKWKEQ